MRDGQPIRILFVYPSHSSFVDADLRLLGKHFSVLPYLYRIEPRARNRFLWYMLAHRRAYDVVYVWFGDIYATLAVRASRFLRKRVIIVAGGYDTTYIPSIRYGLLADDRKRALADRAFSQADRVLVVDKSLKEELQRNFSLDGSNIQVLHTGYDPGRFTPSGPKEPRTALTVAAVTVQNLKRKGLETFVQAARELPDFQFRLAGPWQETPAVNRLRAMAPENVTITGRLTAEDLISEYQRAQVYAQLSIFEGLPNALAEAMLCECVPVGTQVCGIPTLIGECGFYVLVENVDEAAQGIERASRSTMGSRARNRIASLFPIQRRESALVEIVSEVVSG